MKKLFREIRRQNTPDLSLDKEILEKAKKLRAGKKVMLSEQRKELNGMNITMNRSDTKDTAVVKKSTGRIIAAAAAFAIAAGGAGAALKLSGKKIEPASEKPSSHIGDLSGKREVQDWAKPYLKMNPDTVGYLSLGLYADSEGTYEEISFPIVQRDNNEYYETTGYDGQPSDCGAAQADCNGRIDENGQPQNVIIWANDIAWQDVEREISLLYAQYAEEFIDDSDYYFNSGIIRFKTIYDEDYSEYQIVSDFSMDLSEGSENDLAYYTNELRYNNFDEEHSFESWRAMQSSYNEDRYYIFNEDIPCTENDEYLTLSVGYRNDPAESGRTWRQNLIAKKMTPDTDTESTSDSGWAESYLKKNPDTVGMVSFGKYRDEDGGGEDIEFDELCFPVVQTDNNEFYQTNGFDKKPSEKGTPYADCNAKITENGNCSNIVVTGNNIMWRRNDPAAGELTMDPKVSAWGCMALLEDHENDPDSEYFNDSGVIRFKSVYDDSYSDYQIVMYYDYQTYLDLDYDEYAGSYEAAAAEYDEKHSDIADDLRSEILSETEFNKMIAEKKHFYEEVLRYSDFSDEKLFDEWKQLQKDYCDKSGSYFCDVSDLSSSDEFLTIDLGMRSYDADGKLQTGCDEREIFVCKKIGTHTEKQETTDSKDDTKAEDDSSAKDTSSAEDTSSKDKQDVTAEQAEVPDVMHMTQEKAIAALKEAGFDYEVEETQHEGDKGKVIDQSIAAGTLMDKGTVVIIYVSTGETDPITMVVEVPVPEGLKGFYILDVYRDGSLAYTKSLEKAEDYAGKTATLEITGKKVEFLTAHFRTLDNDGEEYYEHYVADYDAKTFVAQKDAKISLDPDHSMLYIDMPEGLRGSYTFDVYREGSVAYTKIIDKGEAVSGSAVRIDIVGKDTETLVVYIKSNDLGEDNYIKYATYEVDYSKGAVKLVGELNTANLLAITPKN